MRIRTLFVAATLFITPAAGALAQKAYTPWSEPLNLGATVNTGVSEFFSCVSKDGLSLFFTSPGDVNRPSLGGLDI